MNSRIPTELSFEYSLRDRFPRMALQWWMSTSGFENGYASNLRWMDVVLMDTRGNLVRKSRRRYMQRDWHVLMQLIRVLIVTSYGYFSMVTNLLAGIHASCTSSVNW
ncbi:hypothetical protein CY34DRAFT_810692 [Suillus luteus UH-Slu-Lm8-n1]|uniref:Uncharacterized protein n=1 Tax=Suillus luteus UH-Slu-Lm8-n1 TaxID=930992 RepID=A0A0C9ZI63_9AGAM|nr:hypothetical protein CY34DRAFT_810692 [Suillus luteus UH-Slu-Lm8-n1]